MFSIKNIDKIQERLVNNLEKIKIDRELNLVEIFGAEDKYLKIIESELDLEIFQRDGDIVISGEKSSQGKNVLNELISISLRGEEISEIKIEYILSLVKENISYKQEAIFEKIICYTYNGKPIIPKTIGQKRYIEEMEKKDIVFGIGPAGTGKTYLAVAMAASMYKQKRIEKIILARPAVEAGESLGFLPGDLQDKVDPYLRPLYDALFDIFGKETVNKLKEKEIIEVVPLAYMRGRTLDRACVILDEAQNTTKEQMKMFLTRMGFNSKMIITGDVTQIDLPRGKKSGLIEATRILKDIKDISFSYFKEVDVVRHHLVKKIISAYESYYRESE